MDDTAYVTLFNNNVWDFHYFKTVVDPEKYLLTTEKISEEYDLFRNGWKRFERCYYYDYLSNSGTFTYCVKFFSSRELFKNINITSLFSDLNMNIC